MRCGKRGQTAGKHSGPFWNKDAVIYELHVRAFKDSNADGIGDLTGRTNGFYASQIFLVLRRRLISIYRKQRVPFPSRCSGMLNSQLSSASPTGVHWRPTVSLGLNFSREPSLRR
jgi:hypothetical protein